MDIQHSITPLRKNSFSTKFGGRLSNLFQIKLAKFYPD